jgi:hypothetical protein
MLKFLWNFLTPELSRRGIELSTIWATAHTAKSSVEIAREIFPEHVISQRGELPWPARSPDLCVCDYFLWGYLKAKVYHDLKIAIRKQISEIPENLSRQSLRSLRAGLEECICNGMQHISDVLFKTKQVET